MSLIYFLSPFLHLLCVCVCVWGCFPVSSRASRPQQPAVRWEHSAKCLIDRRWQRLLLLPPEYWGGGGEGGGACEQTLSVSGYIYLFPLKCVLYHRWWLYMFVIINQPDGSQSVSLSMFIVFLCSSYVLFCVPDSRVITEMYFIFTFIDPGLCCIYIQLSVCMLI